MQFIIEILIGVFLPSILVFVLFCTLVSIARQQTVISNDIESGAIWQTKFVYAIMLTIGVLIIIGSLLFLNDVSASSVDEIPFIIIGLFFIALGIMLGIESWSYLSDKRRIEWSPSGIIGPQKKFLSILTPKMISLVGKICRL